jgi:hypothetical protein
MLQPPIITTPGIPPDPGFWDPKWIVAIVVALWGAILSTYQAIIKWQENREDIRVRLHTWVARIVDDVPQNRLVVDIVNHGRHELEFGGGFIIEFKGYGGPMVSGPSISSDEGFPHILKPRSMVSMDFPMSSFDAVRKMHGAPTDVFVRAVVADVLGRPHFSAWRRASPPADWPKSRWSRIIRALTPWKKRYIYVRH